MTSPSNANTQEKKLISDEVEYRVKAEYEKYHNEHTFKWNGKDFWQEQIVWKLTDTLWSYFNDQRAKDLKKLSFMFGIPLEDLTKALEAKDYE